MTKLELWWSIAYFAQPVILAITGGILWWYTKETQRLRKTAELQIKTTQEQIETIQRPFVVITPKWHQGSLTAFIVGNIGNSVTVNVELIYGKHRLMIPTLKTKEEIRVDVLEDGENLGGRHAERRFTENEPVYTLDKTSLKEVIMKIEYCNVAMMQYSTTQKILPEKVITESSGKMGVYNSFA
jgi:hypothetical protein